MTSPALVSTPGGAFFQNAKVYSPERGDFVSQKHMDLATVLHDYDSNFQLVYIPEHQRTDLAIKPFAIQHVGTETTTPHIIRYLDEHELNEPHKILAWLRMGDLRYNSPAEIIERIETEEKFEQLLKLKRKEEEAEDRLEELAYISVGGKDRKHYYRHGGVTYRR